jgi:hypothetical protein
MRGDSGRHRAAGTGTRSGFGGGGEVTRPVRLAVGTLTGILLAVIIPVLLALLG